MNIVFVPCLYYVVNDLVAIMKVVDFNETKHLLISRVHVVVSVDIVIH